MVDEKLKNKIAVVQQFTEIRKKNALKKRKSEYVKHVKLLTYIFIKINTEDKAVCRTKQKKKLLTRPLLTKIPFPYSCRLKSKLKFLHFKGQ